MLQQLAKFDSPHFQVQAYGDADMVYLRIAPAIQDSDLHEAYFPDFEELLRHIQVPGACLYSFGTGYSQIHGSMSVSEQMTAYLAEAVPKMLDDYEKIVTGTPLENLQ